MNKAVYLFLLFTIFNTTLFGQKHIRCHSDERTEMWKELDPKYYESLQNEIVLNPEHDSRQMMAVVTIPVHVIIVHPPGQAIGTGVNFPMDHIQSQIDVLNEDFRRLNGDASNTPDVFDAADSEIEFCLAVVDPNGNATDGVTRYGTTQNLNTNEFAIKSATGWDRNNYLNMWVGPGLGGILGWAYLPTTGGLPNATLDGVVIASGTFGGPGYGTTNNYDLGRTCTHEVGHYLGLRHIWRSGGCGLDDGFPDTPLQDDQNFGCPNHPSPSCGNSGDMFMNYMDYVNDDCMNAFSDDQGNYMQDILNTSRSSLLDAANTYCESAGVPLVVEVVLVTDVLCFSESTGSVTVQASGGVAPYTYSINNGPYQDSNVFADLAAGTYTVTAQDNDNTIIDIEVIINEPTAIVPNIDTQIDVSCFGDMDGSLIVSAFGGTPNPGGSYLYNIDGGIFTANNIFDNLSAGPHTIIVQDGNGCEVAVDGFIIEPEELTTIPEEVTNITCFGDNNGLISVITFGGNPLYTYSIDQVNYQPSPVFFDLAAGNYSMITLDENGCTEETSFSITEPDLLEVNVIDIVSIPCYDETTGAVTIQANGGTAGYQYSIDGVNYQSSPTFENLGAGTYNLTVLDANNCFTVTDVILDNPAELILDLVDQTDAGCSGQEDGTITVSSMGGSGGQVFLYDGQTLTGDTVTFTNVPAGTHDVAVIDNNNCTTVLEVDIVESAAIEIETTNIEDVSCDNAMDGMIEVEGNGGSGVYFYNINAGAYEPENTFNNLAPGSYTIGVLDEFGCEGFLTIILTAPDAIETEVEAQENPGCFGMTGSVDLGATGGSGVFEFTLNGSTNSTGIFEDLEGGDYNVLVTDENNCSEVIAFTIEEPAEISLEALSNTGVTCFGDNSGSVTVNATGGNNTFDYTLGAETNSTGIFENLNAGTYTTIATDANGCSQSIEIEIETPELLEVAIDYVVDVNCAGAASGAIQVDAVGGAGMITYTLGGVSNNTGLFEGLVEGSYTVEVIDNNDCETSISAAVASTTELEIAEEDLSPVSCFGEEDGSVQLTVSGGNGSFEFTLGAETNNTGIFENLSPGSYEAVVTDGAACSGTYEFEIAEPASLQSTIDETNNPSCFGENNGSVQISATGGTGVYTFEDGTNSNDTGLFENLNAGTYQFSVMDENGCSSNLNVVVDEPVELIPEILSVEDAGCDGGNTGAFVVIATGGVGAIQYNANGETNTNGTFNDLAVGSYPVTFVDENGCETTLSVDIDQVDAIDVEVTETNMNDCFGSTNGTIQIAASGGSGAFEFTLGAETNSTGYFENLAAGDYDVEVVDINGCSEIITQNISEPMMIESEVLAVQNPNCFGESNGIVEVVAQGGNGGFQYTLDNETNSSGSFENLAGGTYDLMVTDALGCMISAQIVVEEPVDLSADVLNYLPVDCFGANTGFVEIEAQGGTGNYTYTLGMETNSSGDFINLSAGDYPILIVDENGCSTTNNISVTEPEQIISQIIEIENIDCFDANGVGSVQVQASGGNGSFQYTLGSETNGLGIFDDLTAGTYEIQIIDANGCTGVQDFAIVEGANLDVSVEEIEAVNCFGESTASIEVTAEGGNGTLEYTLGTTTNSTGIFDNLSAGNYMIMVTDVDGCQSEIAYEITEPNNIMLNSINVNQPDCFGSETGSLNVIAEGGNGGYSYMLNSEVDASGNFENLPAGEYLLVITDAVGCTTSSVITVDQPISLSLDILENESVTCYGADDGMLQVSGLGGVGGFTYTLGMETNTTGLFENLPGGIYTISIEDGNGCTEFSEVTITQPDILEAEILSIQSIGCSGNDFGAVQIGATGGMGAIDFTLDSETNNTGTFNSLDVGSYEVIAMDANGCTTIIPFSIEETDDLDAEVLLNTPTSCFGETDGQVLISVTNSSGSYTYTLGTMVNDDGMFSGLSAGDYTVDVTNGSGCNTSVNFTVEQPNALVVEAIELQPLTCFEASNAVYQLEAFGGNGPYIYTLNGQTNTFGGFENLASGTYEAFIQDASDCTTTVEITIIEPEAIQSTLLSNDGLACFGDENGMLELQANGGAFPYEYSLDSETNTTGVFDQLPAGNYQVLITDDNGCTSTENVSVAQPPILISGILNITSVLCYGGSDGVVFIGADGGTPGYQFELDGEINGGGVFFDLPAGMHLVNVTDQNGCISETSVVVSQPNELLLNVENTEDDTGTGNGSVSLSTNGGISPYQYSLDGVNYGSFDNFNNLSVGTYTAYVRDANGCISEIMFSIEMGTSISNVGEGVSDIQVYPNPFTEKITLQVDLINAQSLTLKMYTIHGQELFNYNIDFGAGMTNLDLDIPNDLPVGAYIISVGNERTHLGHYKMVKQ